MEDMVFKSEKNNQYAFSEHERTILYLPPPSKEKDEYTGNRNAFIKKYGLKRKIEFTSKYDPDQIKNNLANLRMLIFEVTDRCNLACKYCGYRDLYNNYDHREGKELDFSNAFAFLEAGTGKRMCRLWTEKNFIYRIIL
jgi:sulfatase maturation enzyme AslB (radical SAM superfamily)